MSDTVDRLSAALSDRYTIEREIGAGGMATVYLAEDLKHERKVAVKVLRPELAAVLGAERFLNEIKVTANLQHPHILPLHDSGEADSFLFYVMPYVEGESLRQRMNREKQLSIDEAVEITRSVASALDYAHRHEVIHRDIKPENILLHDGQPVVADFGIALAVSVAGGARLTETGLSLGTPQYMSPEQATGDRELDRRSDTYSLACVLYEMLTGDPPHTGSTVQALIAKVVTDRARPVREIRDTVPTHVEAVLDRALEKLPADRFVSIAEFAAALDDPSISHSRVVAPQLDHRKWMVPALAFVGLITVVLAVWGWFRPTTSANRNLMRFIVKPQVALVSDPSSTLAISRDGTRIAHVGVGPEGMQLYIRELGEDEGRPIPGTLLGEDPAFSPDGEWLAFVDREYLRKVPTRGGATTPLFEVFGTHRGVSWGDNDVIVLAPDPSLLLRVSATSGEVDTLLWAGSEVGIRTFMWPELLPGARAVLFAADSMRVFALDMESGELKHIADGTRPRYARSGHLTYVTGDGTLMMVPFDAKHLAVEGSAFRVAEGFPLKASSGVEYDISDNGSLVYLRGHTEAYLLAAVDRSGREEIVSDEPHTIWAVAYSPTADRVAVTIRGETRADIWLYDTSLRSFSRRTYDGGRNPSWTTDGRYIVYSYSSELKRVAADGTGTAEVIYDAEDGYTVGERLWSPDGEWLVIAQRGGSTGRDIVGIRLNADSVRVPLVQTAASEKAPALSPDGRWLAYTSNETGRDEVYVQEFPGPGSKFAVTTTGGTEPRWSPNGRELFYRTHAAVFSASVQTSPVFRVLDREQLFLNNNYLWNFNGALYDIHPDGDHLLMSKGIAPQEIAVVLNWLELVR